MGGHSHWAGIKHKKAANDAKKGKVWTKMVREITIAAKIGGGSPEHNARLRKAMDDARAANMPAENIKRAVQKGTGEIPGVVFEELTYEGYAPGGVAVYAEGSTDNRNRSTNEIRKIFENNGGNMGQAGCVSFLFEKKGYIGVPKSQTDEDKLLSLALDLGAEDMRSSDPAVFEVLTSPQGYESVLQGLKAQGIVPDAAEVTFLPKTEVAVSEDLAPKVLALIEALEDHDDVSRVYANFDIPDKVLAALK